MLEENINRLSGVLGMEPKSLFQALQGLLPEAGLIPLAHFPRPLFKSYGNTKVENIHFKVIKLQLQSSRLISG